MTQLGYFASGDEPTFGCFVFKCRSFSTCETYYMFAINLKGLEKERLLLA